MANFFKKKGGGQVATSGIQMTDSEAALAQSDFNIEKITEIQSRFTGGMVLLYPGRIFIREGVLWKMCRKGPKKRHFFLFNDILVYGSVVANRYSNQHILPLSQMSVSAECFYQPRVNADFDEDSEQMELDAGNAFQISHADKSFHVFSLSSADKANWLANLHKHINKVAQMVSNDKQMITKPVWVPDSMSKECMVCSVKFTAFIRKHHCRRCGRVVCSTCSPHRMPSNLTQRTQPQVDSKKMERVCKDCFKDTSTVQGRPAGSQVESPPTPPAEVAAQMVSSVIASQSIKVPPSTQEGQNQDSSTDTEDSDDSESEQQEEAAPVAAAVRSEDTDPPPPSVPVPDTESDTQPTPPPRKKKLKKKLEQIVERQLDQHVVNSAVDDKPTVEENEVVCDQEDEESADKQTTTEDPEQGKSPKKSRRKKKHIAMPEESIHDDDTTTDDREIKSDSGNCETMNEEEQDDNKDRRHSSIDTTVKKTRTRKTKFT